MEKLEIQLINSKNKKEWIKIAREVLNENKLERLIQLFIQTDNKRIAQKAAGVFMTIVDLDKNAFYNYQERLVKQLSSPDLTTTQSRNIFRLFQFVYIREEVEGELLDAAIKILEQPTQPIAIRAFALTTVSKIAERYPEIIPEIRHLIELNLEMGNSSGFNNRAQKILRKLNNIQ